MKINFVGERQSPRCPECGKVQFGYLGMPGVIGCDDCGQQFIIAPSVMGGLTLEDARNSTGSLDTAAWSEDVEKHNTIHEPSISF